MRFADLFLILRGATSGEQIIKAAATASGAITLPAGTTDFSGAGPGVVKQASAGAAFTVAPVAATEVTGLAGLTADALIKGGGAGAAPVASTATVDGSGNLITTGSLGVGAVPPISGGSALFVGNTSSNRLRLLITGGTVSVDSVDSTGTASYQALTVNATTLTLVPANGVVVGGPTGGAKGAGTINAAGVYANNVLLTSDARYKRDIAVLPDCLDLVQRIEPKMFRFIDPGPTPSTDPEMAPTPSGPPGWADKRHWGFVAQDVEGVMPDAVEADTDGNLSLSLPNMTAVLWKALQEAMARIEALEARGAPAE